MKDSCHQCRIIRFPKISILKNPFGSSVEHDVADKLYIYIYIYTHTHTYVCVCVCVCVCVWCVWFDCSRPKIFLLVLSRLFRNKKKLFNLYFVSELWNARETNRSRNMTICVTGFLINLLYQEFSTYKSSVPISEETLFLSSMKTDQLLPLT